MWFWPSLGGKIERRWHLNRTKNEFNLFDMELTSNKANWFALFLPTFLYYIGEHWSHNTISNLRDRGSCMKKHNYISSSRTEKWMWVNRKAIIFMSTRPIVKKPGTYNECKSIIVITFVAPDRLLSHILKIARFLLLSFFILFWCVRSWGTSWWIISDF